MTDPPLPTFLVIGAQKSATRWLRYNLGLHPEVFAAPTELRFFSNADRFASMGVEGYRAQFSGWSGEPVIGEATPAYMMWRHHPERVAERVRSVVPDVRLLAVLRNPIDRAVSAVLHHTKHGRLPPGAQVLDVVTSTPPERDKLGIVNGGWYAASLRPYRDLFGEQLLVLVHDDVTRDPGRVYDEARRHIGATAEVRPPELSATRFSNRDGGVDPKPLSDEERTALWAYFARDVEDLEQMFGLDLSAWRPGATLRPPA